MITRYRLEAEAMERDGVIYKLRHAAEVLEANCTTEAGDWVTTQEVTSFDGKKHKGRLIRKFHKVENG